MSMYGVGFGYDLRNSASLDAETRAFRHHPGLNCCTYSLN